MNEEKEQPVTDLLQEPIHKLLNWCVNMFETHPEEPVYIKYVIDGEVYNINIAVEKSEDTIEDLMKNTVGNKQKKKVVH